MLLIKTLRYVTYINSNLLTIQLLLPFFLRKKIVILLIKVGKIRLSYIVDMWWSILHPHDKI